MSFEDLELSAYRGAPVECFAFVYGATTLRQTGADEPITIGGNEYVPAGIDADAVDYSQESGTGDVRITVPRTHSVAQLFIAYPPQIRLGVTVLQKHRPDSEFITRFVGRVVSCQFQQGRDGFLSDAVLECVPEGKTDVPLPVLIYQGLCQRTLYGPGCGGAGGIDIADFTVAATVTAISGLTVSAAEFATKPDGWFRGGYLESVATGERRQIEAHVGDTLTLQVPFSALAVSDAVNAVAGCDRTRATCAAKFNNLVNNFSFDIPTRNPFTQSIN